LAPTASNSRAASKAWPDSPGSSNSATAAGIEARAAAHLCADDLAVATEQIHLGQVEPEGGRFRRPFEPGIPGAAAVHSRGELPVYAVNLGPLFIGHRRIDVAEVIQGVLRLPGHRLAPCAGSHRNEAEFHRLAADRGGLGRLEGEHVDAVDRIGHLGYVVERRQRLLVGGRRKVWDQVYPQAELSVGPPSTTLTCGLAAFRWEASNRLGTSCGPIGTDIPTRRVCAQSRSAMWAR